jgi:hypothetical protein
MTNARQGAFNLFLHFRIILRVFLVSRIFSIQQEFGVVHLCFSGSSSHMQNGKQGVNKLPQAFHRSV